MPTTRKQKSKGRKSREAIEMLSDLESMDILLGSNHFVREDNEFGNSVRRSEVTTHELTTTPILTLILVRMHSGNLPEMAIIHVKMILVERYIGCQEDLIKESL